MHSMKLTLLCYVILLATSGCAFREDRDRSDPQDRSGVARHGNFSTGVDHGEYPGDKEHGETMLQ